MSNPPYDAAQSFHPLPPDLQREDYFRELHHHQQPIISSLSRRIAALESSLRHHAASRSQSLRDAAARTIQTYFRAFLVRRSRTLRQLKDLASIKSAINVLKSSVSDNNPLDPLALSHKALQLMLKLDSIRGDDPMIRDGKKSINLELTRFLDFIDGVTVKRSGFVRENVRQGESSKKSRGLYNNNKKMDNRDRKLEDLVNRIEALYNKVPQVQQEDGEEDEEVESPRKNVVILSRKGGFRNGGPDGIQAKVKKNVKFSEDGNVYYVPRSRNEPVVIDGDDITDLLNAKKKLDLLRREAEEVSKDNNEGDEVAQSDDGESTKSSDDDDDERGPTYSAPLPVRMETRPDLMDKRKTSKLVE